MSGSEGHRDQKGKPEVRDLCRQCSSRLMSLILTFCVTYSDTNVINSEILQINKERLMTIHKTARRFKYAGLVLPDPSPELDVESVRSLYAASYPEITTATL